MKIKSWRFAVVVSLWSGACTAVGFWLARVLVVALVVAGGCGGSRDVCDELGVALCDRSATCDLVDPAAVDACVADFRRQCDERPPAAGDDQVDACVDALAGFDCDELAAGEVPPECQP